jgi:agmatine deiminase
MMTTPAAEHFFMPAEWHPHQCCWMAWPCRATSWPFDLARVQASYLTVAQVIARFEQVRLITPPEHRDKVQRLCGGGIEPVVLPIDDAWLRDTGPTFVINPQGGIAGIDWQFNAWGEKHESLADYQQDVQLAQRLLAHIQVRRYAAPLVLEGGAVHVDGEGTVLVTEACLLHTHRNPGLTRQAIEEQLQAYLGVKKSYLARTRINR